MNIAYLYLKVLVDCPNCRYIIDLMEEDDTSGENHDDGMFISSQVFGLSQWTDFEVEEVKCSKCSHIFNVNGLEY